MRKISILLENSWKLFYEHWKTILASGSIIGLLVCELWPSGKSYQNYFFFLGFNALLWTVIAIKVSLDKLIQQGSRVERKQFETMRVARNIILENLSTELAAKGDSSVLIFGGRVRAIIEILREFRDLCEQNSVAAKGTLKIDLFLMSPDFIRKMNICGNVSASEQIIRNNLIANQVSALISEIKYMNSEHVFKRHRISILIHTYNSVPFSYFYIFGNRSLIFGGYVWDRKTSDLLGPSSPCWYITSQSPEFSSTASWLRSRAALLEEEGKDNVEKIPELVESGI